MDKRNQIIRMALTGLFIWLIAFCAYKMGKSDQKDNFKEIALQSKVDSLTGVLSSTGKIIQETLKNDSLIGIKLDKAITNITNIKPIIRYEIKETSKSIDILTDSTVRNYIDSIRAAGGFH